MQIPKDAVLLRIFLGENDHWQGRPLYEALVLKAREMHLGGATVLRGAMGYGANSKMHTTRLLELSSDLPVLIEVVDTAEKINSLLPFLDEVSIGHAIISRALFVGLATVVKEYLAVLSKI